MGKKSRHPRLRAFFGNTIAQKVISDLIVAAVIAIGAALRDSKTVRRVADRMQLRVRAAARQASIPTHARGRAQRASSAISHRRFSAEGE
jgi:hypothetical protein